jgi:hypothetical protein
VSIEGIDENEDEEWQNEVKLIEDENNNQPSR